MNVLKFGGTSVGTIKSLRHVKAIVESREDPVVVVVSALGGLTDRLIALAGNASSRRRIDKSDLDAVAERHHAIIEELVPADRRQAVTTAVDGLLSDLGKIFEGIALVGDLSERTLDMTVSFGERMSSIIVANIIEGAVHRDSLDFIKTEKWFNKNIADTKLTTELIRSNINPGVDKVTVIGGFISTDRDTGDITNLGRGGSDYTAALVAASLGADELEIWTDVDGFMTSDPRIISGAKVIDRMTFVESMELCSFGAKVIYPPTIYPVFHKNIPIRILNTFNPQAPGTYITDTVDSADPHVRGISSMSDVCLVAVKGHCNENFPELNSRSFNAMAKNGIGILLVSHPSDEGDFSFAIKSADAEKAFAAMNSEFGPELASDEIAGIEFAEDMAILAVVGENISRQRGLEGRIYNTLQRSGIKVFAASHGVSTVNYSFVISRPQVKLALRLIHESLFD